MPDPFSLVIFDCDGVLVDSEPLGNRILVEAVAELGLVLGFEESLEAFRGRRMAECVSLIAGRLGRAVPEDFVPTVRARAAESFRHELQPIPGIHAALSEIPHPVCVASNGPPEQMALSLTVTGLLSRFAGRLFSAYEVQCWKPDPGLFLHAATACGASPARCAVVEDSVPGVQAAIAAGMTVFGYAPLPEREAELSREGAVLFREMSALPALLDQQQRE